jgi:hypothetical protein
MNTALDQAAGPYTSTDRRHTVSAWRRFFGVVTRPRTYANLTYLLLGLPLGTIWFVTLVTGVTVAASFVLLALIGIPMLYALWYVVRTFANVERGIANALLDREIPLPPMSSPHRGNVWSRLRTMTAEADRRRELGYLLLRFPVGVATFSATVTAITVPVTVAIAPISARYVDESFGNWFWSTQLHEFASESPWSWTLVPIGALTSIAALHLTDALARACGRWSARALA